MVGIMWLLAGLLTIISAQPDPVSVAEEAFALYEQGQYQAAAELYEVVVTAGVEDPAIFINLAHAYYAQADLGRALVNYRRAQVLTPRDASLSRALAQVRSQRRDIQGEELAPLDGLTALTVGVLRMDELFVVVGLAWAAFFVLLAVYWVQPQWREVLRVVLLISGVLLVFGLLLLGSRWYSTTLRPPGVVVAEIVTIKSGPGDNYLDIYRLYAAAELRVLEDRGEWLRFVLPDERQGWIRRGAVAMVAGAVD